MHDVELPGEDHRMKFVFRKISFCFIFLQRLQHSKQIGQSFQERKIPRKSNFRVASLCFLFLRRLHAFESQFRHSSTCSHHGTKASFRVASLCFVFLRRLHAFENKVKQTTAAERKNRGRRQKRNYSTKQKCSCCKLNTESVHGEEQTRTILTNTFRDIVPKLSRILVNQDPFSSSSIWTSKNRPPNWPKELPWKDPNNKPKDTFEILEKKMHTLQELCEGKQIPTDIAKEVKAYKDYRQQVQSHKTGDISKLQVIRQKRKVTHKLTAAMREFAEVVHWHGAPERSNELEEEAMHLKQVLRDCPNTNQLSVQFDEIFYAIANVEGSGSPHEYMQQFSGAHHDNDHHQGVLLSSNPSFIPYLNDRGSAMDSQKCLQDMDFCRETSDNKKTQVSFLYRRQQAMKRSASPIWKMERDNHSTDVVKKKYIL